MVGWDVDKLDWKEGTWGAEAKISLGSEKDREKVGNADGRDVGAENWEECWVSKEAMVLVCLLIVLTSSYGGGGSVGMVGSLLLL